MALELPPKPTQGAEETSAAFDARMLNWWRECDILLRADCQEMKAQWMANVVPQFAPTLDRIANAWDAMDVRLGELATALGAQQSPSSGLSESFLLALLRLVLDKPEPSQ
ncbi:MAG TPA: hypothetical protein PKV98_07765 [Burkholderiaceae bacterium]|nr:hypothetical protein [Burkholderiaceae bacterium]